MVEPIYHHLAGGIHPGAFVQPTAPDTTHVQDHVLWIDTSGGSPYQLKLWDAGTARWLLVGITPGSVGVDGTGAVQVACLTFPAGPVICGDDANTLEFDVAGGTHLMLPDAYTLPSGHRLELLGNNVTGPSDCPALDAISEPIPGGADTWYGFSVSARITYTFVSGSESAPSLPSPVLGTIASVSGCVRFAALSGIPSNVSAVNYYIQGQDHISAPSVWWPGRPPNTVNNVPDGFGYVGSQAVVANAVGRFCSGPDAADAAAYEAHAPTPNLSINPTRHAPADDDTYRIRLRFYDGRLCWEHDGDTWRVYHHDVLRLQVPLPVLSQAPATLVGKDPTSGLPAFCPAPVIPPPPVVPVSVPITPVVPDPGSTAATARCGAAVLMATYLENYYHNLAAVIGALETGLASWLLSAVMDMIIEAATDGAATGWLILNQALVKRLASFLIINAGFAGSDFPQLNTTQTDAILQACYCALGPVSGSIAISDAIIADWNHRLDVMSVGLTVPEKFVILALMGIVSTQSWQRIAYEGSATPSGVCSGFTCP